MSCASTKAVLRLTLIISTFVVSCAFVASLIWMLRVQNSGFYENYQLSRLNLSLTRSNGSDSEVANASQTLVKMEISIRRVEENSRRLKEYTRSLLWDNKDKSLWCILFKEGEREEGARRNRVVDEDFIEKLRKHKLSQEIAWHVRHGGIHRHVRHKN